MYFNEKSILKAIRLQGDKAISSYQSEAWRVKREGGWKGEWLKSLFRERYEGAKANDKVRREGWRVKWVEWLKGWKVEKFVSGKDTKVLRQTIKWRVKSEGWGALKGWKVERLNGLLQNNPLSPCGRGCPKGGWGVWRVKGEESWMVERPTCHPEPLCRTKRLSIVLWEGEGSPLKPDGILRTNVLRMT